MDNHLTDEQLFAAEHGLDTPQQRDRAAAHLQGCTVCRARQEELARRLSSLDLLKDELEPATGLVAGVIGRVKDDRNDAFVFRRRAVAAVLLAAAALLILAVLPWTPRDPAPGGGEVDLAALREQQPFAPASQIELNVLPRRDDVQLTIYNAADMTLVREKRELTLKQGWNWLQFMWANTLIDPTSLELQPLEHADKIDVQALVFPPRIRELGRWMIFSEVSGSVPVEITYLTSGISWRAFYMATLAPDEAGMTLQGYVRLANRSGETYADARTRLVVGEVHLVDKIAALARRQHAFGDPRPRHTGHGTFDFDGSTRLEEDDVVMKGIYGSRMAGDFALGIKQLEKEALSEYFLYSIEGSETIPDGWDKRLPSFSADDIPVRSLYKYDEERWGAAPVRFLSFANDEEHRLGETPIPEGRVSAYRLLDADRHLSYTGDADSKYVPVGEEVEWNLGPARYVTVEPKIMDTRTENTRFDRNGNLNAWDDVSARRLRIVNARDIPVRLEITRNMGTPRWEIDVPADAGYEKHDATHARFTVELAPRSEREIDYTVRLRQGNQ